MPDPAPLSTQQREVLATVADLNHSDKPSHARQIAVHAALTQVETGHALIELHQAALIELRPGGPVGSTTGWHLTRAGRARYQEPARGI